MTLTSVSTVLRPLSQPLLTALEYMHIESMCMAYGLDFLGKTFQQAPKNQSSMGLLIF